MRPLLPGPHVSSIHSRFPHKRIAWRAAASLHSSFADHAKMPWMHQVLLTSQRATPQDQHRVRCAAIAAAAFTRPGPEYKRSAPTRHAAPSTGHATTSTGLAEPSGPGERRYEQPDPAGCAPRLTGSGQCGQGGDAPAEHALGSGPGQSGDGRTLPTGHADGRDAHESPSGTATADVAAVSHSFLGTCSNGRKERG